MRNCAKTEIAEGVRHAHGDAVTPEWVFRGGEVPPHDSGDFELSGPERQPKGKRASRLCPEVWAPLFGLPRVLADAQLLWPKIQRQWLSAYERSGCPDLAEPRSEE